MKLLFQKLFDIRDGELNRALLMFGYIFLVITCLLMLKPVRNSLFLAQFHANSLPYVFIWVAITAAFVSTLYSRFANRFRLNTLIRGSLLFILANLLGFWLLMHFDYQFGWFIYIFYVWVAIFGVITTSQFWVMANYIFNAREARRLFGFIGAGAISGGIFGGYLTNLAPLIGTKNLLLICMFFLSICLLLLHFIWKNRPVVQQAERRRRRQTGNTSSTNPLRLLKNSRHLAYLAAIVGVSVIVANLVDYQFNAVVEDNIPNMDERTAFFGVWLSNLSVVSLVIQLFFTRRILSRLGVGASLFFLPIGILFGAIAILLFPVLWAAVLIKVSDGSFKQSINKAGLELLFLPVSSEIKQQAKAFIDVFVDSFATGLGGVLLIYFTGMMGMSTAQVSLIIIVLILIWIVLIVRIRREYVQAFRTAIEKRAIDLEEYSVNLEDGSMFEGLLEILQSDNQRQILYVLNLIEHVKNPQFFPHLQRLIHHNSPEIRRQALKMIGAYPGADASDDVKSLIHDADQAVRTEAVGYLISHAGESERVTLLEKYLNEPDFQIRAAALMFAAKAQSQSMAIQSAFNLPALTKNMMSSLRDCKTDAQKNFIKITVARAIGEAKMPELAPFLEKLMIDPSSDVVQAAIISAGKLGQPAFIPKLIELLANRVFRKHTRDALALFGEAVVEKLTETLSDANLSNLVKMHIPRTMSLIDSQKCVDVLTENLDHKNLTLRYEVLRSLNRLRKNFPDLKFSKKLIEQKIFWEFSEYFQTLSALSAQRQISANGDAAEKHDAERVKTARQLLIKALEEKLAANLDRIFRLLGLRYQPKDMYNAYLGIMSPKSGVRANAVEFLDNFLAAGLKQILIPIVERMPAAPLLELAKTYIHFDEPGLQNCLENLLCSTDPWLLACAIFLIAETKDKRHVAQIEKMVNSASPIVKETAEYALKRLAVPKS